MTAGTMEAGTARIITAVSMADGTTRGTGAGMTLGTARTTILITADGTEDGILTGDITIITDIQASVLNKAGTFGTAQGIRPVRNAYSQADPRSEEA